MKLVALAAIIAALVVPSALAATPTLTGTVGPGFTITLKKGTAKVTKLKAGAYVIKVSDKSSIHNFRLKGPGVNKTTSVGGTGTSTWKVTLKKGKYTFVCDPHATIMKGVLHRLVVERGLVLCGRCVGSPMRRPFRFVRAALRAGQVTDCYLPSDVSKSAQTRNAGAARLAVPAAAPTIDDRLAPVHPGVAARRFAGRAHPRGR